MQTCAHEPCVCQVRAGEYCSSTCEDLALAGDATCRCGHEECLEESAEAV